MVYNFVDKKTKVTSTNKRTGIYEYQELVNELHLPLTKKFEWLKLRPSYQDNIWGADLGDMQLIIK